jgi:hypothetical protein
MASDGLVRISQIAAAVLGIPAAAAATYSAYQTYFSAEMACHRLRTAIIASLEKNLATETKRALLRKDVTDFNNICGESDPDARAVFQAAMEDAEHPASPAAPASAEGAATQPVAAASPRRQQPSPVGVFGASGSGEHHGWVALSRREAGSWVIQFNGYEISETTLPPRGTVLSAQRMLPVWLEPQAGVNDTTKLQGRLPAGACVRVLATRVGAGRLWAEVAPTACL